MRQVSREPYHAPHVHRDHVVSQVEANFHRVYLAKCNKRE